jgi:hypothetical protein
VTGPTAPTPTTPTGSVRRILARASGALYVHVHSDNGAEHETLVLSPARVRLYRWLLSPAAAALGALFVASWVGLAIAASRVPATATRIAELEVEVMQLDTLEVRLMELQLRYDQVSRMLGASRDSTPDGSTSPVTRND